MKKSVTLTSIDSHRGCWIKAVTSHREFGFTVLVISLTLAQFKLCNCMLRAIEGSGIITRFGARWWFYFWSCRVHFKLWSGTPTSQILYTWCWVISYCLLWPEITNEAFQLTTLDNNRCRYLVTRRQSWSSSIICTCVPGCPALCCYFRYYCRVCLWSMKLFFLHCCDDCNYTAITWH